jgi:zinc protease
MELRVQTCHPQPQDRSGRGTLLLQFALSISRTISTARSVFVLRRIGMTSLMVGMCLTSTHSAFAIAGVDTPPPPSSWHEIKFVTPKETRLENGLRVIVAERPGLPLLSAEILVGQGAVADPPGLGGTATMTGELLTRGTESMSAPRIAEAIESLGGTIGSGAGRETSAAYLQVMSVKADRALRILADVVMHPAFKQDEIDRLRNQRLDYLRVMLQQPASLARLVTERVVFGAAPYGHALNGTLESLPAIGREEIVKFYRSHYLPRESIFVLAGDVTLGQGRDFAEKLFGAWKNEEPGPDDIGHSAKADWKPRDVVVDMPEAGQAAVTAARPAIRRTSPEYYAALVANAALGNGFASRLNREVRVKRGLSYGAGSSLEARRQPGLFSATVQTKNESAAEVAGLLQVELRRMVTDPVAGAELQARKAVLTGRYARDLETNDGFVDKIAELAAYHLPLNTLDKYIPSINAVTSEAVTEFAKKYFAQPMSLVVVGKAKDFLEALKKNFPDPEVIEQKDLDLNQADLIRPGNLHPSTSLGTTDNRSLSRSAYSSLQRE